MAKLRIAVGFVASLAASSLALTLLAPDHEAAQAQVTAAKKKGARKSAPKQQGRQPAPETRPQFTQAEQETALVLGLPDVRAWGDNETDFRRLLPQTVGPWLAISGGGSDGAFGAGVLAGWSQTGNRPEFAVVAGVSIGGVIAPFAFLGSGYDEELRKTFTTISAADIFEDRVTRESLFDSWPLKRSIEERVTSKLLSAIAAEHRRGRRLFVVTTNLDAGRRVVWNMGAIAERDDDKALKLFRDVLLASCSIPGFFPTVAIDAEVDGKRFQEIHGDGTITAPFFVAPEAMFTAVGASRPPFSQFYVIVNSKLSSEFKMPDRTIPGVLSRSIDVALTAALRAEVMLVYAGAQRHGIGLRVAHINAAFNHPSHGPFDGKYMHALFEFGIEQGKKGNAFDDRPPELSLSGSQQAR